MSPCEELVASKLEQMINELAAARSTVPTGDCISAEVHLIELGIMDSLAVFEIVAFAEREFGVSVPNEALVPENFATLATLARMVMALEPVTS